MLRWSANLVKGSKSVEETIEDWGRMHPVGRVARPEEVAEVIAFLARASFVTGAITRSMAACSPRWASDYPSEATYHRGAFRWREFWISARVGVSMTDG